MEPALGGSGGGGGGFPAMPGGPSFLSQVIIHLFSFYPLNADHDYNQFVLILLHGQITVIGYNMTCV